MDIAILDKETGAIQSCYQDSAPNQAKFGGPWGDSSRTVHVVVPEGMDPAYISSDENYVITEDTASKDAAKWTSVRGQRDQKLTACDWTQVADAPLTSGKKTEWAIYRQELRDVPEDNQDPDNISWPIAPTSGS